MLTCRIVAVVAALAVPACAAGGPGLTTEVSEATVGAAAETWPLVGGGTVEVSADADQPLVLWFWAPG